MGMSKSKILPLTLLASLSLLRLTAAEVVVPAPAPANVAATPENADGVFALRYDGRVIFSARLPQGAKVDHDVIGKGDDALTETVKITLPAGATLAGVVHAGAESLAAETRGAAQKKFPMVRTSHGPSSNRRNNAVYDRTCDWMIEFSEGARIAPSATTPKACDYAVSLAGTEVTLTFRPAYYRKHKNLPYYFPWTYSVRKDSITGWSSWWAYERRLTEKDINALLAVFSEKRFADYGYRFIQIDDVYQGRRDGARKHSKKASGYLGGSPDTWLDWRTEKFPSGLEGYVTSVKKSGFSPAVWMGCFFSDTAWPAAHPDWFVQDKKGAPAEGSWVSYVIDNRNREAADTLIRPTFRGLRAAGMEYVKIDQLRHMLYDNLHKNPEYFAKTGTTPAELLRGYLGIAREELGKATFILACWGVLPESIGLVDACRIGGDGYGPATLQQYNSWNGIVWRNDPDHCDVMPTKIGAELGNVTKTLSVKAAPNDTRIRPALASLSGTMLILSDRPDVYRNDATLAGLRKSSPVLFSVPGQLYDFDASKTDHLRTHARTEITSGANPAPIDAAQFGAVCPYWLNEFSAAAGDWVVLHRLNWAKTAAPAQTVAFADIGLDPDKEYVVHEFWTGKTLGVRKGAFETGDLDAMGIRSFAIREKADHPQLISTSRHLSQGAAEIENLRWDAASLALTGRSRIIAGDDYSILLRIPAGYALKTVTLDTRAVAGVKVEGEYARIPLPAEKTASAEWVVSFERR